MKIASLFSKITQALIPALFLFVMLPLAGCSSPAPESTAVESPYPLTEPGPYAVGKMVFS